MTGKGGNILGGVFFTWLVPEVSESRPETEVEDKADDSSLPQIHV